MNRPFYKFPHTYHLFNVIENHLRNDKILNTREAELFYSSPLIIEEKVDGANLGFSLSEDGHILSQNRGRNISEDSHPQFKYLNQWIQNHDNILYELLFQDYILFGEWCYARHSIHYDRLPDWFLAFDIYDRKSGLFLSRQKRHELLKNTGISEVPYYGQSVINKREIIEILESHISSIYKGPVEGLYLRIDSNEGYLLHRAKVVRAGFIQNMENHWTRSFLVPNLLKG